MRAARWVSMINSDGTYPYLKRAGEFDECKMKRCKTRTNMNLSFVSVIDGKPQHSRICLNTT